MVRMKTYGSLPNPETKKDAVPASSLEREKRALRIRH